MSTGTLKKVIIAVTLTLAVMFGTGVGDALLGLSMTPSAHACSGPTIGSGSGGGGGC